MGCQPGIVARAFDKYRSASEDIADVLSLGNGIREIRIGRPHNHERRL